MGLILLAKQEASCKILMMIKVRKFKQIFGTFVLYFIKLIKPFVNSHILVNNLYVGLSLESHNSSLHKINLDSFKFHKNIL